MRRYAPWKRLHKGTVYFLYSLNGLRQAFGQKQAFEYEVVVLVLLCVLLFFLRLPLSHGLALLGS